jgi:predicted Na+-dependent transporter
MLPMLCRSNFLPHLCFYLYLTEFAIHAVRAKCYAVLISYLIFVFVYTSLNFLSMQNSVLGVVLATKHFGNPLTAVPCAVSSICHSVYGSIVAGIWRSMPPTDKRE